MLKKTIIAAAVAALAMAQVAKAQNIQVFWDFGKDRSYVSTTFEMYKPDKFGDTFWFIDHYFSDRTQYKAGLAGATGGSYFEIERGLNFWQDTALKDLSAHIEYDGSTWGWGIACFGAKYCFHSEDYSKTLTLYLMYDLHLGTSSADVPVKFSAVWGLNNLFGLKWLSFKGFLDAWGNNSQFISGNSAKLSILTEPQIWFNLGSVFDYHLDLGTEIELSYNFAGHEGFMVNPCAGLRWTF